jgi:hypothetical protein
VGLLYYQHASPENVARAFRLYMNEQTATGAFAQLLRQDTPPRVELAALPIRFIGVWDTVMPGGQHPAIPTLAPVGELKFGSRVHGTRNSVPLVLPVWQRLTSCPTLKVHNRGERVSEETCLARLGCNCGGGKG